jgi:hypothetical protein
MYWSSTGLRSPLITNEDHCMSGRLALSSNWKRCSGYAILTLHRSAELAPKLTKVVLSCCLLWQPDRANVRFFSWLIKRARMAKSADAADLKSAGRKAVGVQVPLWAPKTLFPL